MNSATRPHEHIEELIAADVLDGLDDDARLELERAMAVHGPECQECLRLQSEYREVATGLALSLEPAGLSAGSEERLIAAASEWTEYRRQRTVEVLHPGRFRRPRRGALRMRGWAVAAAAAVIAVLAGAIGYGLAPGGGIDQRAFADFVSQPGTRVVRFTPRGDQTLAVALHQGEGRAWVLGQLSPPPSGKVYELWFFGPDAPKDPLPAGTFEPQDGVVLTAVHVGPDVQALAVSVEPKGGSKKPTTKPVFQTTV